MIGLVAWSLLSAILIIYAVVTAQTEEVDGREPEGQRYLSKYGMEARVVANPRTIIREIER